MVHGPPLLGLKFIKSLVLDGMSAWRLTLGACGLLLGAWSFFPVAVLPGPRFVDPDRSSAWHKLRLRLTGASSFGSRGTCRPDPGPDMSLLLC